MRKYTPPKYTTIGYVLKADMSIEERTRLADVGICFTLPQNEGISGVKEVRDSLVQELLRRNF